MQLRLWAYYGYGCAMGTDTGVCAGVDVNFFMTCTVFLAVISAALSSV